MSSTADEWAGGKTMTEQDSLVQGMFANNLYHLAEARQRQAARKEDYETAMDIWKEDHAVLIADFEDAKAEAERSYSTVALAAIALGEHLGTKKPHPLVSLISSVVLSYDEGMAFAWAKEHGMCLTLDKKAFEVLTKATGAATLPFVTITEELKARVASDLSSLLEEVKI